MSVAIRLLVAHLLVNPLLYGVPHTIVGIVQVGSLDIPKNAIVRDCPGDGCTWIDITFAGARQPAALFDTISSYYVWIVLALSTICC